MISSRRAIGSTYRHTLLTYRHRPWVTCPAMANRTKTTTAESDEFLESLMETRLYSMGAYFSDQHPDLVEDVVEQSVAIEEAGIRGYADDHEMGVEECFQMMLTGLALRYYNAVAG